MREPTEKKTVTSSAQRAALSLSLGFTLAAILSSSAYAQDATATISPIGRILCNVIMMLWGNFGRALACLAVISLGVGAMMGKLSWGLAMTVAIGLGVMFGAAEIAGEFLVAAGDTMGGDIGCSVVAISDTGGGTTNPTCDTTTPFGGNGCGYSIGPPRPR